MNTALLDTLVALGGQHAHDILVDLHMPQLSPCWVFVDSRDNLHVRSTPWSDQREKELAAIYMRRQFKKHKAKAYSLVTEAYTLLLPAGTDLSKAERPSTHPDRQEVVMAFATDGTNARVRRWFIRRDFNELIIALEPDTTYQELHTPEGWMTELLNPKYSK